MFMGLLAWMVNAMVASSSSVGGSGMLQSHQYIIEEVAFTSPLRHMSPLHPSKNDMETCIYFVNGIKNPKLDENNIFVSFDASSLYTKVPVKDVIRVIREITSEEIAKLVEICLKSTYFSFRGEMYEKIDGVSMGSPLSSIVANLSIGIP